MEWLEEDTDGQWDCQYCIKHKLQQERNCEEISNPYFVIDVFERTFVQCPLIALDEEAMRLVNVVLLCEGGGMGGSRILPSQYLGETAVYWNIRSVVLREQRRIQKIKDKNKEKK